VRFRIQHDSSYRYDVPVSLGSHVVRLTPRPGNVVVHQRQLTVQPAPSVRYEELDAFGNPVTRLEFSGATRELRVSSTVELDTLPPPALCVPLPPLPFAAGHDELGLFRAAPADIHPEVQAFALQLAREVREQPVAFLDHLTRTLYERTDRHIRPSGSARPGHETLALRSGACRDITVLFLEVCRYWGMAARFVSGYQAQAETPDGQRHLHAWAEVFLPGLGFQAWDATHGVRVGEGHVALCAAPGQVGTMPIDGGFYFSGATVNSTLDYSVRISTS
jgi:transglutaminase-like putative cysteine protease